MQISIDVPEQYLLDTEPVELGRKIKLYAAVLTFQSGQLSAGAATEFADVDRTTFAMECRKHGVPLIAYPVEQLAEETEDLS